MYSCTTSSWNVQCELFPLMCNMKRGFLCLSIYRKLLWRLFSDLQLLTKHFMLFLGQCLGTSRTDWSRRICSKSSCRSSPVLWGNFPGRLPITKARYAIFLYPDLIYPCTNIIKGLNISATAKFGDMSNLH